MGNNRDPVTHTIKMGFGLFIAIFYNYIGHWKDYYISTFDNYLSLKSTILVIIVAGEDKWTIIQHKVC